jgi:HD-like signal output (HDOD) protein
MTHSRNALINIEKLMTGNQLPALPQSAIRLLELSQDLTKGPAEYAVPIEGDPGLASQVLKFVNSSYFGFAREISTVKMAITLVGTRTIKNFALWSAVFSLMPNPRCGPLELKGLWQDSLCRGLTARKLGEMLGMKDAEESFSAALLQDMSIPILAKEASDIYVKLLRAREDGRYRLSDLEREVFGWTHATAGGMMARHWNLPEQFALLVESHSDVEKWIGAPTENPSRLAVAMSALLPAVTDSQWWDAARFEEYYNRINVPGGPKLGEFLAAVDVQFTEFAPILKLAAPSKSLVESYEEAQAAAASAS